MHYSSGTHSTLNYTIFKLTKRESITPFTFFTLIMHIHKRNTLNQIKIIIIIIIDIYIAHIAEASKRLETEGRVEMTIFVMR